MVKEGLSSSLFSIKELSEKIKDGDITPVDLVENCLNRIKTLNPVLNAFITVIEEQQLYKQAQIAEKEIKQGKYRSPLHGIPFSIKDIFHVKGVRCTAGSKILANYVSNLDATIIKKMSKAGAILIGTNNLNEFASGITGINPFYGTSKNPWDVSKISGGSSGGSAVAVATGMAQISLGTDTGGSIRVPSSLCGIVGLKPTYGRLSEHGYFPLSPSLDHVGSLTRSVWDAAVIMEYIAGGYSLDETSENNKTPAYTRIIEKSNLEGLRIGLPKEFFFDCLHPKVEQLFHDFIKALESMGSILVYDLDLHYTGKYYTSWRDIRLAEAAEIHLKWLNTRAYDYSDEVRNMLIQGTKISAVNYIYALTIRERIRKEFLSILSHKVNVIIVPTTIIPAPRLDQETVNIGDGTILQTREALLRNAIVFNSTGLPTISIPIGLTKDNMPVGAQIIGPPLKEEIILSIAYNYEGMNNSMNKFVPPCATIDKNKL